MYQLCVVHSRSPYASCTAQLLLLNGVVVRHRASEGQRATVLRFVIFDST